MAGHSAASLTASIRNNLTSTISSLEALTQSSEFDRSYSIQIRAVIESLQALEGHIHAMEQQLSSATTICAAVLREKISGSLSQCSITITPLVKQLQRLDTDNVHNVSGEFWITLGRVTATQSRLFSFYTDLLKKGDESLQEESISSHAGEERLSQADDAISNASEAQDIFGENGDTGPTSTTLPIRNKTAAYTGRTSQPSTTEDQPPPYTPSQDDAGVGSSTAPPPFPLTEQRGWFKRAFTAIADAVRPTPGPFVVALCEAVANGDLQQARSLLDQGANMNGANEKGDTPLKVAVMNRQLACLQMLIEAGAQLKIDRTPALFAAAKLGQLEAVQMFLDNGQRVDDTNAAGQPYFVSVVKSANIAGIRFLLDNGADADAADVAGQSVLATAVAKGKVDVVELLLNYGASADTEDVSGQPAIVTAVNKRNIEMVKLLLRHGASANAQEITGAHVLASVISRRNKEIAQLLLEHDADPNPTDILGVTALANAVEKRDLDMVKLLLTYGASANVSNISGQPIVIILLQSKRYGPEEKGQVLQLLLEHGAPVDGSDIFLGSTVMQVAQEQGNAVCIKLLREYGAK